MDEKEKARAFKEFFTSKTRWVGFIAIVLYLAVVVSTYHFSPKSFIKHRDSLNCQPLNFTDHISMKPLLRGYGKLKTFELMEFVLPEDAHENEVPVSTIEKSIEQKPTEHEMEPTLDGKKSNNKEANITSENKNTNITSHDENVKTTSVAITESKHPKKTRTIPVLFWPGDKDHVDRHLFLAKLMQKRTKKSSFRFRFYSMDLHMSLIWYSLYTIENHNMLISYSLEEIQKLHPDERPLHMSHGLGSVHAIQTVMIERERFRNKSNNFENVPVDDVTPGMMIFESSPWLLPGHYENTPMSRMRTLMFAFRNDTYKTGAVSFEAGFDDTTADPSWLHRKNAQRIPVWTIDDVPDNGLTGNRMAKCAPYLDTVADFLMFYGERRDRETGKSVAETFHDVWESRKRGPLPNGWEKDRQKGAVTVQVGEKHSITVNGVQWIDVDVQRNKSIILYITGPCLTAATIIRGHKFIKRKDELMNGTGFEFGIYQLKPYEDVKLLLESSITCSITIETNPWWLEYTQKFYYALVFDPYHFWVGAQITSTLLAFFECEKRSFRLEHQLYIYVFFIAALFYHTLYTYGFQLPGLICGAGFALSIHFVCSTFDDLVLIRWTTTSLDAYYHRRSHFSAFLCLALLASVLSTGLSTMMVLVLYSLENRAFLAIPTLVTHIPILYRIWYIPFVMEYEPRLCGTLLFSILCYVEYMFGNSFWGRVERDRSLLGTLAKRLRQSLPERFSRRDIRMCLYPVLLFILVKELTLEWIYGLEIFLVALNRKCQRHTPTQLRQNPIDLQELEEEYLEQEDED
ncbi:hypothetical protein L3Y34_008011 [Caenorhabditis briggsae]|nr:hypothetical protein L3Y34_008011 [Caenorhabditis briggsae]